MNTTKPTPGPWRADTYLMGAFEISAEIWDHGCIVLASRARHETRADEMHANARLIASAPDLLFAIKCCNEHFKTIYPGGAESGDYLCGLVRNALQKATGAEETPVSDMETSASDEERP